MIDVELNEMGNPRGTNRCIVPGDVVVGVIKLFVPSINTSNAVLITRSAISHAPSLSSNSITLVG